MSARKIITEADVYAELARIQATFKTKEESDAFCTRLEAAFKRRHEQARRTVIRRVTDDGCVVLQTKAWQQLAKARATEGMPN